MVTPPKKNTNLCPLERSTLPTYAFDLRKNKVKIMVEKCLITPPKFWKIPLLKLCTSGMYDFRLSLPSVISVIEY